MKYQFKENRLSADKLIFLIIGGLTLIAIIFIGVFSFNESKQAQGVLGLSTYLTSDKDKPKIVTSSVFSDLGNINVNDEKTAQFTITNTGNKPLNLFKISSSCDCTYGQITINNTKSPEFSMHSKNPWVGTVDPGKNATLAVIYRPFVMPVKGEVTRDVYVQTNDPQSKVLTFTIKANVE